MDNTRVTITPLHLSYRNRSAKPMSLLFKFKRILISTDYELEKFECKKTFPFKGTDFIDLTPYAHITAISFTLSKELEISNTKVDIIIIGCLNKDVNFLGIATVDLGIFQHENSYSSPGQSFYNELKIKLNNCDDDHAYLCVSVLLEYVSPKSKHNKHSRSKNKTHDNDYPLEPMGVLETESYYRQTLMINRRKKPDIPTAYEISHRNYKQAQILRTQDEPRKSRNGSGSYKKRFDYQYNSQGTSTISKKGNGMKNNNSPQPRLKTPEPIIRKDYHHNESQRKDEDKITVKNKNEPSPVIYHHHKISKNPKQKNENHHRSKQEEYQQKRPISKSHAAQNRSFDHSVGNPNSEEIQSQEEVRKDFQQSPNIESIKDNKFKMITEKLQQIERKIANGKNSESPAEREQVDADEHPRQFKLPYKQQSFAKPVHQFSVHEVDNKKDNLKTQQNFLHPYKSFDENSSISEHNQIIESEVAHFSPTHSEPQLQVQVMGKNSEVQDQKNRRQIEVGQASVENKKNEKQFELPKQQSLSKIQNQSIIKGGKQIQKFAEKQANKNQKLPKGAENKLVETKLSKEESKVQQNVSKVPQGQNKVEKSVAQVEASLPAKRASQVADNSGNNERKKQENQQIKKKASEQLASQKNEAANPQLKQAEVQTQEPFATKQVEVQTKQVEIKKTQSKSSDAKAKEAQTKQLPKDITPQAKQIKQYEQKINALETYIDEEEENHRKALMEKQLEYKNRAKEESAKYRDQLSQLSRLKDENEKQKILIDKLNNLYEESDDKNFEIAKNYQKKCLEYERRIDGLVKKNAELVIELSKKKKQAEQSTKKLEIIEKNSEKSQPEANKKAEESEARSSGSISRERPEMKKMEEDLVNQKKKSVNLQAQLRYRDNELRFLKIKNENLQQQKKDLENEIDMIAANNKHEMARKGSISKMNLEGASVATSVKMENKALKEEIISLQKQVHELNELLEGIINKQAQAHIQSKFNKNKELALEAQDANLLNKYNALEDKVSAYEQQLKKKQIKIADLINLVWSHGDQKLMEEVDKLIEST